MNGATSQSITVNAKRKQTDNNTVGQVTSTPSANQGKDTKEDELKDKAELVQYQHTFMTSYHTLTNHHIV